MCGETERRCCAVSESGDVDRAGSMVFEPQRACASRGRGWPVVAFAPASAASPIDTGFMRPLLARSCDGVRGSERVRQGGLAECQLGDTGLEPCAPLGRELVPADDQAEVAERVAAGVHDLRAGVAEGAPAQVELLE